VTKAKPLISPSQCRHRHRSLNLGLVLSPLWLLATAAFSIVSEPMSRSTDNRWLHRFATLTAAATFVLIGIGGLVTSHEAGLAVPDWPTSYGYNMFLFPPSYWIGGIFYEHTHRLVASFVGLLTTILAAWLWLKESRRWMRWLGVIAFFAVVLQGVLGGLRVTLFKDQIGIFHATLAQLFVVLVSAIALMTSRWWQIARENNRGLAGSRKLKYLLISATALVVLQLILGASMRHQHAGLAVPDFPLAYGKIWPPTDPAFLDIVNRGRIDFRDHNPITAWQIYLHMAHRIGAMVTLAAIGLLAWRACQELGRKAAFSRFSLFWFGLTCLQAVLGVVTVLSNKAADVATVHVVLGASSLVSGALLCVIVLPVVGRKSADSCLASDPARLRGNPLGSVKSALPIT
jgi:cytochrome c oxidase assembly protein subunit 15